MNADRSKASLVDAALFLSLLAQPGDAFELRALVKSQGQPHINSGYFDDMGALAAAAIQESGRNDGVYITINPVHPGLLARAPKNRVRRAGNGDTTSDRDVTRRTHLLVDVDPIRPAGISSTDAEHQASIDLANRIADEMSAAGWPDPIRADSGNGGHLIYAVDLPVNDDGLIKRVLGALSQRYTTAEHKVDEKVFNPARISKIYGTLTRKGEDTAERPHRVSRILRAPDALVVVSRDKLEALSPSVAARSVTSPPANGNGSYSPSTMRSEFSLDEWISQHIPDAIPMTWSEGRKWLIQVCPFNSEHDRREAYITEKHGGMIAAGCQHESCFKSWRDLRARFEPDAYERRSNGPVEVQRQDGSRYTIAPGQNGDARRTIPQHEVVYQDPEYASQQAEIDAIAERDREPDNIPAVRAPLWKRAPDLVDMIWGRKDDPWISMRLGPDEICRVRLGGTVVVLGGPGSGKSSLVTNIALDHAREVGPAIVLSIELPMDELGARGVGIQTDSSWEDVLRGLVPYDDMKARLDLPRFFVLDREHATIENLIKCVRAAAAEYPGQPIMVAIDYAQLLESKEREVRMRVADAFAQIDRAARSERFVAVALSQMSRAGADAARSGEKIGAESASLGAESAAIERFATITLTIGQKGEPRADGSVSVELSLGKGRMSGGDVVFPASYWGKSGKWRLAGDSQQASAVRETRDVERQEKKQTLIENALIGAAQQATGPVSRDALMAMVHQGSKKQKIAAVTALVARDQLVEVNRHPPRSRSWCVWTLDRQKATPELLLVRDMPEADR